MFNSSKELPEIVFDSEILNTITQGEISRRVMDQKKYAYNGDVKFSIGNNVFDTVGCENTADFLNKYSSLLSQIGFKLFAIEQMNENDFYKVTIDDGEKRFTMTTENCDSIIDFKIKNQEVLNQIPVYASNEILNEIEKKLENKLVDNIVQNNVRIGELSQKLQQLQQAKRKSNRRLLVLDRIKDGTLSFVDGKEQKTESFIERKKKLEQKMDSMNIQDRMKNSEYRSLLELEETTVATTEKLISLVSEELEKIEQEISQISTEIEMTNTKISTEIEMTNTQREIETNQEQTQENSIEKLPGSSSSSAMLPRKELEADYYQRLENAANEGPIFHDNEINFNISKLDKKTHIIKKVSKAPQKLLNKIKNFKFSEWITPAFNFMKKYKVAIAVAIISVTALGSMQYDRDSKYAENSENVEIANESISQQVDIPQNMVDENIVENENISSITNTQSDILAEKDSIETTETSFNEELQTTLNSILEGDSRVYISSDTAINNTNGIFPTNNQLNSSWSNATPGAYYTLENNQLQKLTEQEASNYWQDGGTVAVRMDDNGNTIGFVPVEHQEDTQAKGM